MRVFMAKFVGVLFGLALASSFVLAPASCGSMTAEQRGAFLGQIFGTGEDLVGSCAGATGSTVTSIESAIHDGGSNVASIIGAVANSLSDLGCIGTVIAKHVQSAHQTTAAAGAAVPAPIGPDEHARIEALRRMVRLARAVRIFDPSPSAARERLLVAACRHIWAEARK